MMPGPARSLEPCPTPGCYGEVVDLRHGVCGTCVDRVEAHPVGTKRYAAMLAAFDAWAADQRDTGRCETWIVERARVAELAGRLRQARRYTRAGRGRGRRS